MKEPFTPEKIYNEIKSGKSSKSEFIEVLISLIERSDEPKVREKSIEVCEHLICHSKIHTIVPPYSWFSISI